MQTGSSASVALRAITLVMGFVLLFGAIVQYNDPDPFLWGLFYLTAAITSFASLRRALPWWLPSAVGTVAIAWAIVIALGVDPAVYRGMFSEIGMASLEVEEAREVLGLVIIGLWMAALAATRTTRRRSGRD